MVEAVRRCGQHFKTGLLTNNFVTPISASGVSALAEVLALFDAVVESSVVGVRKPDERFYLLGVRGARHRARPRRCSSTTSGST